MLTFRATRHGNIMQDQHRCPMQKKCMKDCVSCENNLGMHSFYGRYDKVICKGEKPVKAKPIETEEDYFKIFETPLEIKHI